LTDKPRKDRTVLDEAKGLVHGNRNEDYGSPADDFGRAAGMLTALFAEYLREGQRFTASDIAKIQIVVKLSRLMHKPKTDSWVDIAGYAETGDWAEEDGAERNASPGRAAIEEAARGQFNPYLPPLKDLLARDQQRRRG
jgi:hypothetical protein